MSAPSKRPVPPGVYYCPVGANFYSAETRQGMGAVFFIQWNARRSEFPQSREAALSPVENSPSPALGGDEAQRSEQKDHPTPVGGLEPVAWIYGREGVDRYADLRGPTEEERAAYTIEPLYSSSTVSTLQAEIERLRKEFRRAAASLVGAASAYRTYAGRSRTVGRGKADPFFTTRAADFDKAVERARQALGGSHD